MNLNKPVAIADWLDGTGVGDSWLQLGSDAEENMLHNKCINSTQT